MTSCGWLEVASSPTTRSPTTSTSRCRPARWLHQADIHDGLKGGITSTEQDEVVQLRRDNRRLVMEHEILRRAGAHFAKDTLKVKFPLVRELADEGFPVVLTGGAGL